VLYSSVLPELSPAMCQAVTGRADARSVLDALLSRQLFLTVLDEAMPVLRLHDLFRDFLHDELERREPGLAARLHARAAAAETQAERAVPHRLAAGRWSEALAALRKMADGLLAVGGTHRVERWLEQLPPDWRAPHADAALLRGLCAWSRWDWVQAREEFKRSHDAFAQQERPRDRCVVLGMLGACHNALAALEQAGSVLATAADAQLPPALQVAFDSLRAWHGVARGDGASVLAGLDAMADNAALAPAARYPNIVDMSYGHFIGLPGTRPLLERLAQLCRGDRLDEVQVPALDAWLAFCMVRRDRRMWHFRPCCKRQRQLPGDVMLGIGALHLLSLHLAVQGRYTEALAAVAEVPGRMALGYGRNWRRTYLHVQARIHWRAGDAQGLTALLPELTGPRSAREWPVLDTGAALVQGQQALLCGDLEAARPLVERAAVLQGAGRLAAFMGDARFALAACCTRQGAVDNAATVFRCGACRGCPGCGLGSAAGATRLGAGPLAGAGTMPALLGRCAGQLAAALAGWQAEGTPAVEAPADDPLSAREREVLALLAEGRSNKLIARALALSLHTAKRHVANILNKLAQDSPTQAAAYWHQR
jgi:LuxR family maltose regulon positive regulatory protein